MDRRAQLSRGNDYDDPLRLVGQFLREAAAPPRACAARLHVRTAERLRAGCRSNGSWLLLRHGFGIKKLRNIYGRRCATTFVRQQ